MSNIHELKILPEYFIAINEGDKKFEIRKNDRNFQVGDFLLLKEFQDGNFTGCETLHEVTFMTNFEQKEGYVVMSISDVPRSFRMYLRMSEKEKATFKKILSHIHLHGYGERDTSNTLWDIIRILIGNDEISETEQQWFMEYWSED